MKQLLDFLPLVIFFAVYKLYDIYMATGALIAATAIALGLSWLIFRKVEKTMVITFLMVTVFGTLTLVLHNDAFIKWKVTFIYGLFAVALLFTQYVQKRSILQRMLGKELILPAKVWHNLNLIWVLFFTACAVLNIYVAFWLPQQIWVNFKVFGLTGLMLIMTVITGLYLYRHMPKDER